MLVSAESDPDGPVSQGKTSSYVVAPHQWYISLNGQQQGPVSAEQVADLALKRRILLTDHVWREGMAGWSQLQYVEELIGLVRRIKMQSRSPSGSFSRPPSTGPAAYRSSQPPAEQSGHSQRPAPRQNYRPRSLQSYRSAPVPSQRPQPTGPAPDDKVDGCDSQSLAKLTSSPARPQFEAATNKPSTSATAAESVQPPRLDPETEAASRSSSILPQRSKPPSATPSAAPPLTTSAPAAAAGAPGASRTILLLSVLSAFLALGLAGTLAFFILRSGQPAAAPATPTAGAAEAPFAAAPPAAPTRFGQEQREEEPEEVEQEAAEQETDERQTFVFALEDAQRGAESRSPRTGPQPSRIRPKSMRTKAFAPVEKETAPGEGRASEGADLSDLLAPDEPEEVTAPGEGKRSEGADLSDLPAPDKPEDQDKNSAEIPTDEDQDKGFAETAIEEDRDKGFAETVIEEVQDKSSTETPTDEVDPFAEPLKKAGATETPAAPEAEKPAPPKPDPNRSIDDLLDLAVDDDVKSKTATPKPAPTASSSTTATRTPAEAKPAAGGLPDTPSRDQIVSGIRLVLPAAKACGKGEGGTAKSQIIVSGATGRVVTVTVTDVRDDVGTCIARALRRARFPKFARPTFNVSYPIRL